MALLRKSGPSNMKSCGIIFIVMGFFACLTIIGAIAGLPMIIVGIFCYAIGANQTDKMKNTMHDDNLKALKEQTLLLDELAKKNNTISIAEEIEKLAELKNKGIITDEEFELKKKQLLNQ